MQDAVAMFMPIRHCQVDKNTVVATVEYTPDKIDQNAPDVRYVHGTVQRSLSTQSRLVDDYKREWARLRSNLNLYYE